VNYYLNDLQYLSVIYLIAPQPLLAGTETDGESVARELKKSEKIIEKKLSKRKRFIHGDSHDINGVDLL
jgi:hypothetical protein